MTSDASSFSSQGILSSYEEVLQKLREFRSQLESLQDQTVGSISDLNDLIRQQDELVRAIENQVRAEGERESAENSSPLSSLQKVIFVKLVTRRKKRIVQVE